MSTITDGGGEIGVLWNIWGWTIFKVHRGGAAKTFGDILPDNITSIHVQLKK